METSARYDNKWLGLNVRHVNNPHLDKAGENWRIMEHYVDEVLGEGKVQAYVFWMQFLQT